MPPKTLQPYQLAAKKLIQNHLAEAHKLLAAAETLSGENHIFHVNDTGRLNDLVDGAKDLLAVLSDVAE